ncbi:S-layer family protein [Waterburya agarophytonicola K14]|uniref:S-layer family protein n=1 Tax=Waterburya agarophytonicola KI4 TaxID=2874699 RepID=A0A964BN57_9CYAN|nr:hypothetical protein [Waterburya agarophytonicola]MCC0176154.1 S-layer family protein [Waterburya agarophytonicola KI4]
MNITTDSLSLTNLGRVSTSTFGTGNAGNIMIEAQDQVLLDSGGKILAEIDLGGNGTGGDIEINTTSLSIINSGSNISTSIFSGNGTGGNIEINTSSLSIIDSGVAIDTSNLSGDGDAGDINITADLIEIREGSFIDAQVRPFLGSEPSGQGGDITIETNRLVLSEASQITANTASIGNAGNLTINAQESIELSGATEDNVGGLAAIAVGSGDGGAISINTNELNIQDGAAISASNFPTSENSSFSPGTGQPGNINIQANSINLDTEGRIEAATQSELGEGANIDLQVAEDITLRNNSFISARAFNNADGGNLNIDARFVVAFPSSGNGNDLIATAEAGSGGNINLDVEQIFGLQPRNAIDGGNNFLVNNSNDIDVSGDVAGNIAINTNNVDPIRGTTELPSDIVVPESTTQQACEANREAAAKNGLNINGKGGILPDPALPLNSLNVSVNGKNHPTTAIPAPIETAQGKIQPARGVRVAKSGNIILTAYRTNNTGERIVEGSRNCGGS